MYTAFANPSYGFVAFNETNVTAYSDPESPIYNTLVDAVAQDRLDRSEGVAMIGEYISVLKESFAQSKADGKPWQIWAANTMVGNNVMPDVANYYLDAPESVAPLVKGTMDFILSSENGLVGRIGSAMAAFDVEWNLDDFGGFPEERKAIMAMAKSSANNMVVLGGDLHDGYAWILRDDGANEGEPVAINLGTPSVTSPGFSAALFPFFASIYDDIGGDDGFYSMMEKAWLRQNAANLRLSQFRYSGFVAVKATRETHTAEYFSVSNVDRLSDYATARAAAGEGAITASPLCSGSVTTSADAPGSLVYAEECSVIAFSSERPAVYSLPTPSLDDMPAGDALVDCGMIGCTFAVSEQGEGTPAPAALPTTSASACTTASVWVHCVIFSLSLIWFM